MHFISHNEIYLFTDFPILSPQVYYYIVDSPRNEGKDFFEINLQSGEVFTKVVFDREKQGAYALEVEARDGAPSARPNSDGEPNSGKSQACFSIGPAHLAKTFFFIIINL